MAPDHVTWVMGRGAPWWFSMVSTRHSVRVNAAMIGNDGDDDSSEAQAARQLRIQTVGLSRTGR